MGSLIPFTLMFFVILLDQRARGKPSWLAWLLLLYIGAVFFFRVPWLLTES